MTTTIEGARRKRYARRSAQRALRGAGTHRAVGEALGLAESTVCHQTTSRTHPALRDAFEILTGLIDAEGCNGRAFADAVLEAVELAEIDQEGDEVLIERGLYLLRWENELGFREDIAALAGHGHADALRRVASASLELAVIIEVLEWRRIDLHALFRERARAS